MIENFWEIFCQELQEALDRFYPSWYVRHRYRSGEDPELGVWAETLKQWTTYGGHFPQRERFNLFLARVNFPEAAKARLLRNYENAATYRKKLNSGQKKLARQTSHSIIEENEYKGLKWVEVVPFSLPEDQKRFIKLGIKFFRLTVMQNYEVEEVLSFQEFKENNIDYIYSAFKAAVRTGAFQLLEVPQHKGLEEQLKEKFHLKDVIVADIPQSDGTLISAEFVAFLAAQQALARLVGQTAIGIGSGYTMLRFAEHSIPYIEQFKGCKWIPLVNYNRKNKDYYSANYIASVMANRHPFSEALYLPYLDNISPPSDIILRRELELAYRHSSTIFYSANGLGRKRIPNQIRSADGLSSGDLTGILMSLISEGLEKQIAGEVLGAFLSKDGEILGSEKIKKMYDDVVTRVDLQVLKQIGTGHRIWIIASKHYKAGSVLMAIRNGLANALVIDIEIANFLNLQDENS